MTSDEFVAAIDALWTQKAKCVPEDDRSLLEMIARIDALLSVSPFHPVLLCLRSDLLRLQQLSQTPAFNMDDAVRSLEVAHATAPRYSEPLIELGYCYYAFSEDCDAAADNFEHAQELAMSDLIAAIEGRIKVAVDIEQGDEARALCAQLEQLAALFTGFDRNGEVAARVANIKAEMIADLDVFDRPNSPQESEP